jgi:hypothetical protein
MLSSLFYGFFGAAFLVFLNYMVLKVYKQFPKYGIGLVWGSLGIKLIFLSGFTLMMREFINQPVMYAFLILAGVIFSNIQTLLTLNKNGDI